MSDGPITEAAKKAHWWFVLLLGSSISLVLMGMGVAVYMGGYARAEALRKVADRQQHQGEDIAGLKAVIPVMAGQVNAIFEVTRARAWDEHRVIIPDPAAPDGGVR